MPIDGFLQAPGGLYVSMNQMMNYARYLLNGGEFEGRQVLSPDSVQALFTGQIETPYGEGETPHYGLGWSIEASSAEMPHLVIHHGGSMETSQSFLLLVPELKLGISVAENTSTRIAPLAARLVLADILGNKPEDSLEDLRILAALDDIEGVYKSAYDMYEFRVGMQNGVRLVDVRVPPANTFSMQTLMPSR